MSHRGSVPNGQPFGLTRQELIVIRLLCEGATNAEISKRLNISVETVKRHVHKLCQKLGTKSRLEAAMFAVSQNLAAADVLSETPQRSELLAEIEVVHAKIEKYVRRSRLLVQQLAGIPKS